MQPWAEIRLAQKYNLLYDQNQCIGIGFVYKSELIVYLEIFYGYYLCIMIHLMACRLQIMTCSFDDWKNIVYSDRVFCKQKLVMFYCCWTGCVMVNKKLSVCNIHADTSIIIQKDPLLEQSITFHQLQTRKHDYNKQTSNEI